MTSAALSLSLSKLADRAATVDGRWSFRDLIEPDTVHLLRLAAGRLARMASTHEGCKSIAVNANRVEFARPEPFSVKVQASPIQPPARMETVAFDRLEPGEYRAVDLWGEIVVLHRVDR